MQATVHGVAKSRTCLSNFTSLPFSAGSLRFVFSSHFIQRMSQKMLYLKMNSSEWQPPKSLQTINVGEDVEKREPSYTVGGNGN